MATDASPTPAGELFTLTHDGAALKSYQLPLTIHNPANYGQKAKITTVECKGGSETEFRNIVEFEYPHPTKVPVTCADYYFDLDPKETKHFTLEVGPPYMRRVSAPGGPYTERFDFQTYTSVSFRIIATNPGTGETVTLSGENTAPEETLPDWEIERLQVKSLLQATTSGDVETMRRELAAGVSVNTKFEHSAMGTTALMIAAENGHVEAVRALLEAKADVNVKDDTWGRNALFWAREKIEIIAMLEEAGAKNAEQSGEILWTTSSFRDEMQMRPVAEAIRSGDVETMRRELAAGAAVNTKFTHSEKGLTPLMIAIQESQVEAVRALLDAKADVNEEEDSTTGWARNALFHAEGKTEIIAMLAEAGAKDAKDAGVVVWTTSLARDEM